MCECWMLITWLVGLFSPPGFTPQAFFRGDMIIKDSPIKCFYIDDDFLFVPDGNIFYFIPLNGDLHRQPNRILGHEAIADRECINLLYKRESSKNWNITKCIFIINKYKRGDL